MSMAFKMPAKPEMKQSMFKNAPTTFYTNNSVDGLFVAGFIKFPDAIQPTMQKQIRTDPGSAALHGLLTATVAEFAKGGKAKIVDPQFGLDQGLPVEFATLSTPKASMRIRVYIGAKATYVFMVRASDEKTGRYFDSIVLPPEVGKY